MITKNQAKDFKEDFAKKHKYLSWEEMWYDTKDTQKLENNLLTDFANKVLREETKDLREHQMQLRLTLRGLECSGVLQDFQVALVNKIIKEHG